MSIQQHTLKQLARLHGKCVSWLATSSKQQNDWRYEGMENPANKLFKNVDRVNVKVAKINIKMGFATVY